jgi:hypothetical protein
MLNRSDLANGDATTAHGHITRRDVFVRLAGASPLAVGNIGPAGASPDPILAAIGRHGAAWMAVGALGPAVDEVVAARRGRKLVQADWDAFERASAKAEHALDRLLATPPASLEGIRVAITYILNFDEGYLADLARTLPDDPPKIPSPRRLEIGPN